MGLKLFDCRAARTCRVCGQSREDKSCVPRCAKPSFTDWYFGIFQHDVLIYTAARFLGRKSAFCVRAFVMAELASDERIRSGFLLRR